MTTYVLAQLNIAHLKNSIDSPLLKDFVDNLDRINALAESSPGHVWRLQTEEGNATALQPFGPDYLVNMSVWKNIESLHNYVYKSAHVEIMKRRREWFERMKDVYTVLWWVPEGHIPTIVEAKEKLELLRRIGPSPDAFTFKKPYPAPDESPARQLSRFDDTCPAT